MMKIKSNYHAACAFIFVLELLLSSSCHADWGDNSAEIAQAGYGESYSTIEDNGYFCGNGNQCGGPTGATKKAGCDDPAICPNWFRRYIINPIRGALRTNFD